MTASHCPLAGWRALALLATATLPIACRGQPSSDPPIRLISDMVRQPRGAPQSDLLRRHTVAVGTGPLAMVVALEHAARGESANTGKDAAGFLISIPHSVDSTMLTLGEERFAAFCSPCHDRAGKGEGVMVRKGYPKPTALASEGTRKRRDGELFSIISKGLGNMPSLSEQLEPTDRWSAVAWVRVLQRSEHAAMADVESAQLAEILPESPKP